MVSNGPCWPRKYAENPDCVTPFVAKKAPRFAESPAGAMKLPEEMQNRVCGVFGYECGGVWLRGELQRCFGEGGIARVTCSLGLAGCPVTRAACAAPSSCVCRGLCQ